MISKRHSTPVLRSRAINGRPISAARTDQKTHERHRTHRKLTTSKRTAPETEYEEEMSDEDPLAGETEAETIEEPPAKRPLFQLLNDEDPVISMPTVNSRDNESVEKTFLHAPKDECIWQINSLKSSVTKNPYKHNRHSPTKTMSRQRFIWSSEATNRLLQLWEENLNQFRGKKKNKEIYKEMQRQMLDCGAPSQVEINSKMDNLTRKYRVEAEKVRESGVPSQWLLFHTIQKLLIGTKSVNVFEDIMFEKNGETNLASDENSCLGSPASSYKTGQQEEDQMEDEEPQEDTYAEIYDKEDPDEFTEDQDERNTSPSEFESELNVKESISERLLEIEEEKLSIEREKLNIMKAAVRELSQFHKDILKHLNQNKQIK
ncbi:Hypothetical predicted protein [Drosophila guanche]|uniref:Myb/SANT-like DNA-binding domain-containing protein n=1 Tax=Drosophila guanche TaxID=7266 RepID=A0A3B0JP01_DROGU|nr:Hypothetical predicted protein [Drosophila guanche]